eukprot:TRINITY_DN16166_c0_g1_i1.p2 TRINITY_DN16166_c0_g1~~TRINITY_DN16166_c0_g1_i1.p2  ORF type:complete len:237 (-),score=58.22 TRINITY_DN16166_c0_g1_i1:46-672(-)
MASVAPAAGGLTSLDAVKRRLEEDRLRRKCAAGRKFDLQPSALAAATAAPAPAALGSPPPTALLPASGGARAAAFLRSAAGARASPEEAPPQPAVDARPLALEAAVDQPTALAQPPARPLQPRRPDGYQVAARPVPQEQRRKAAPGGVLDFTAERDNFRHILHFLRDGKQWKAPVSPRVREALRKEAFYFGCPGIVQAIDEAEAAEAS